MRAWKPLLAAVIPYLVLVPAGDAVAQAPPAGERIPGLTRRGVAAGTTEPRIGDVCGQVQMAKDALNHRRLFDQRDQPPATAVTS